MLARSVTKPESAVQFEHADRAGAEQETDEHEDGGERQRAALRDTGQQRADDQQPAEHSHSGLVGRHVL